ncbi:MAG TPA: divergent polysaccharide deacetylase family protein, partial [Rhizobiaceae bacterium]|nr:divergent polysaccharide deacetylase family protein [Rhizobiaceae bacterium]
MTADLNTPLGQDKKRKPSQSRGGPGLRGVAVLAVVVAALATSALSLAGRAEFGAAEITAEAPQTDATPVGAVEVAAVSETVSPVETQTEPLYEPATENGSVIQVSPQGRPSDIAPSAKVIIIRDPSSLGRDPKLAHVPEMAALEESAFGKLPVRTQAGARPMDIYARPWSNQGGARIALVIGGLGISQSGTQDAIEKLPGEVTLAFAPQGNSLMRWMQMARKGGHELLMQAPMEPHDYPNIDPGPHTLKLAASAETNLENLQWTLGRMTNYAGVTNYMGGRFLLDAEALTPVMAELAYRGLLYFDDGTATASQANRLSSEKGVAYARGDLVIDAASRAPAAIGK